MADLGHLRAFIDAMGLVGLKTANRVGSALTDAEANNYTFQRAASDTLGFYNDLLVSWIGLASGTTVVPVPSATMKIVQGTTTPPPHAIITLGADAAGPFDNTALTRVTLPAAPAIPKGNVLLTPDAPNVGDLTIELDLAGLGGPANQPKVGLYKGLVSLQGGDPVVEVRLRVVP